MLKFKIILIVFTGFIFSACSSIALYDFSPLKLTEEGNRVSVAHRMYFSRTAHIDEIINIARREKGNSNCNYIGVIKAPHSIINPDIGSSNYEYATNQRQLTHLKNMAGEIGGNYIVLGRDQGGFNGTATVFNCEQK